MDLTPLASAFITASCKELNKAVDIGDAEAAYKLDNLIHYLGQQFGVEDMPGASQEFWQKLKVLKAGYRRAMLKNKQPRARRHS